MIFSMLLLALFLILLKFLWAILLFFQLFDLGETVSLQLLVLRKLIFLIQVHVLNVRCKIHENTREVHTWAFLGLNVLDDASQFLVVTLTFQVFLNWLIRHSVFKRTLILKFDLRNRVYRTYWLKGKTHFLLWWLGRHLFRRLDHRHKLILMVLNWRNGLMQSRRIQIWIGQTELSKLWIKVKTWIWSFTGSQIFKIVVVIVWDWILWLAVSSRLKLEAIVHGILIELRLTILPVPFIRRIHWISKNEVNLIVEKINIVKFLVNLKN